MQCETGRKREKKKKHFVVLMGNNNLSRIVLLIELKYKRKNLFQLFFVLFELPPY